MDLKQVILQYYDGAAGRAVAIQFLRSLSRRSPPQRGTRACYSGLKPRFADGGLKIVVEGYLLYDCRASLHRSLSDAGHDVHHIRAEQQTYAEVEQGLTIEDVAKLPDKPSPK